MSRELQDRINQLDVGSVASGPDGEPHATHATRIKLQRPLAAPEKKALSAAQLGQLQGTAEDLHDVLAEALGTSAFSDMFVVKGTPISTDASLALHIHEVKLNRDCSHAYVSWAFPLLEQFAKEAHAEFGAESSGRFVQRAVNHVNGKLQRREAQFRSYIIKHMSFRRVPRLYFSPWNAQLGVSFGAVGKGRNQATRKGEGDELQAVLRRNPKPPLHGEPSGESSK